MRTFLIYLVIGLCLALAVVFLDTDAYVLVRVGDTALQVTIWVAAFFLVLFFWAVQLLRFLITGSLMGGWRKSWQQRRTNKLINSAVASYASQSWKTAYKQMVNIANSHNTPQPYVLLAADSAARAGDVEIARETYLNALDQFPDNSFQIRLRLAYLEFLKGNTVAAQEYCVSLLKERKKDNETRLLELLIAEEQADWAQLQMLIQSAHSQKLLLIQLPSIERRYLRLRLAENLGAPELSALADMTLNTNSISSDLLILLAQRLAMKGKADQAEQFLRKQLGKTWNVDMLLAYTDIEGRSNKGQIKFVESRLSSNPEDRSLIEALLKLSTRSNDEKRIDQYTNKLEGLSV